MRASGIVLVAWIVWAFPGAAEAQLLDARTEVIARVLDVRASGIDASLGEPEGLTLVVPPPAPERSSGHAALRAAAVRPPRIIVPAPAEIVGGAPRASLRRAIRRSLAPRVRGCFAEARHGDPSWWARANVRLVLHDGRIVTASISGANVDAALAECIAHGVEHLQVPPDASVVVVNYPFRSEAPSRRATAPALGAETEALLDAMVGPIDAIALDAEVRASAATLAHP